MVNSFPPSPPETSNADFGLADLMEIRDQLSDYLSTIERNTDAVNEWLLANKNKIVLFHQKLERAINNKQEQAAILALSEMGEIAGFVLSVQDFRAKAEAAFGRDCAFHQAMSSFTSTFPATLLEEVPEVNLPNGKVLQLDYAPPPPKPAETPKEPEKKGWFNWGGPSKEDEEKKRLEAEKARMDEMSRQLSEIKAEILGLASGERHYYIDSFMDWVADTLAPEVINDEVALPDMSKMLKYQDPAYIIMLAQRDFHEAIEIKAQKIRQAAMEYTLIANAIDRQDIKTIVASLERAYPTKPSDESSRLREILLNDYASKGLAEFILTNVQDRRHQENLFAAYSDQIAGEPLKFSDAATAHDVFEKFAHMALDPKDPISPAVLKQAMLVLKARHNMRNEEFLTPIAIDGSKLLECAIKRHKGLTVRQSALLRAILEGMGNNTLGLSTYTVSLIDALERKDAASLQATFRLIQQSDNALEVLSLVHLCRPETDILAETISISSLPGVKGTLLASAMQAGLLDMLRYTADNTAPLGRFLKLMEKDIMPALDIFPVKAARELIAHSFSRGGLDAYRETLSKEGFLSSVAAAAISDDKKLEWFAALLEPFPSNITRANILYAAAQALPAGSAEAETLLQLERNLVGDNIVMPDGRILCNINLLANIWYSEERQAVITVAEDKSPVLQNEVSPEMAKDIISLAHRRGNFEKELNLGIFRPENIEIFEHTPQETKMHWYRNFERLNPSNETAKKVQDSGNFLHARTGDGITSFHADMIALLQKMEDGSTMLLTKHGVSYQIDGEITLPTSSHLITLNEHVMFNPRLSALTLLNPDSASFDFVIQSQQFTNFVKGMKQQETYNVPLGTPAALARLRKALDEAPHIHTEDKAKSCDVYFNMEVMGYFSMRWISYKNADKNGPDVKQAAFSFKKYGPINTLGEFTTVPETAAAILNNIGNQPGILRIKDTLVHEDSVDDIYYNSEEKSLGILLTGGQGHNIRDVDAEEAYKAIMHFAAKPDFVAITDDTVNGKQMPTDLINLSRITQVYDNPQTGDARVVTIGSTSEIKITGAPVQQLIAGLEKLGKQSALQKTPKAKAWTQKLDATLQSLGELSIRVTPVTDVSKPETMLEQALGRSATKNGASALQQAFATVANLPPAYSSFKYGTKKAKAPAQDSKGIFRFKRS